MRGPRGVRRWGGETSGLQSGAGEALSGTLRGGYFALKPSRRLFGRQLYGKCAWSLAARIRLLDLKPWPSSICGWSGSSLGLESSNWRPTALEILRTYTMVFHQGPLGHVVDPRSQQSGFRSLSQLPPSLGSEEEQRSRN